MTRFKLDAHGDLRDEEGRILGRLVNVEIDLDIHHPERVRSGAGGGHGKVVDLSSTTSASGDQQSLLPSQRSVPKHDADVAKVWATYQRVVKGGKRFTLDEKRKRIIRNALAVRPLDRCCEAVEGLARSPHHNGRNDRHKPYLGIQYALAGRGNESTDERIDKMAEMAGAGASRVETLINSLPSEGQHMVREAMKKAAAALLHPDDANLVSRAAGSEAYLKATFGLVPKVAEGRVEWVVEESA